MELTTAQAAAALGLGEQTIRDHIAAGRLRARRHGIRGLYRIHTDELRAFAQQYNYPLDEDYIASLLEVTKRQ